MRVAVASAVYLGDVAPFLAIARRFVEAGHSAVLVAPEGFRSAAAGEPFDFHPYALDASPAAMHADPEHERLLRHPFRNMAPLARYWSSKAFVDDVDAAVASLQAGFAGADVGVSHPTFSAATLPVARSMGIPVVVGQLFPMMIPTGSWGPPVGSRSVRAGRVLNRAAWAAMRRGSGRLMHDRQINAVRERLGLAPLRGNLFGAWMEADRTVVLASRHWYGEAPADWPPTTWGGFASWTAPGDIPAALSAHIDDGPPPVLVTLGTSAATGAGGRFATIVGGLDDLGLRSVVLPGSTVELDPALAARPGVVPFAPLPSVLPRCAAAVTSGSLGSMAAALSAGVPQVVYPQLFDQVWNGRRIEELGVGLAVRRARDVAPAAARLVREPAFAERARALAARMAAEDGATAVVAVAEALLAAA